MSYGRASVLLARHTSFRVYIPPIRQMSQSLLLRPLCNHHNNTYDNGGALVTRKRVGVVNVCFFSRTLSSRGGNNPFTKRLQELYEQGEKWMQINVPTVYKYHRLFSDGGKQVFFDLRTYVNVQRRLWAGEHFTSMTETELLVYLQMPLEIEKLCVIVVMLVVPFGIYALTLGVLLAPRLMLTRHFWSETQRKEYWSTMMKNRRTVHYNAILKKLTSSSSSIKNFVDANCGSNQSVSVEAILEAGITHKDFPPIEMLSEFHREHLCRVYGLLPVFGNTGRLNRRALAVAALDQRLSPADINTRSPIDIQFQLLVRSIDVSAMDVATMRQTLHSWRRGSLDNMGKSPSFILHAPMLLQPPPAQKQLEHK